MKKKNYAKRAFFSFAVFIMSISVLVFTFTCRMRPVITRYSETVAERILLNSANKAVAKVLTESGITYDEIVKTERNAEGNVTSLCVDTVKINILQSGITLAVSEITAENETFVISIPLGTFLGSEYTNGYGPRVKFNAQLTSGTVVTFSNEFREAGLNQVIHRIVFNIETSGRLVMLGKTDALTVTTSAIVAETVIVGVLPEALTNVIGSPSELAGIINDYGAVID
mgnify:CR=1 FL=1